MKRSKLITLAAIPLVSGCVMEKPPPYVPAMRYANNSTDGAYPGALAGTLPTRAELGPESRAQLQLSPSVASNPPQPVLVAHNAAVPQGDVITNDDQGGVFVHPSSERLPRAYRGPLALGDAGVSSSLWRESRSTNDVFRDIRAWQPMDVVTIVVVENSRGNHDADTEIKQKSEVLAAIQHFFGVETKTDSWNPPPDLDALVQASTKNDFKGEGSTSRQAQLTARISAVVAEVLPSGLLRIEGEKIISVNSEEQVMVISGLVRQRDINSNNEVQSAKIAQMRIDYYGKGIVGEAQYGGWFGRLMHILWPF